MLFEELNIFIKVCHFEISIIFMQIFIYFLKFDLLKINLLIHIHFLSHQFTAFSIFNFLLQIIIIGFQVFRNFIILNDFILFYLFQYQILVMEYFLLRFNFLNNLNQKFLIKFQMVKFINYSTLYFPKYLILYYYFIFHQNIYSEN